MAIALTLAAGIRLAGQQASPDTLSRIMSRLDELEKQNKELISEIQALRSELEKQPPAAGDGTEELKEKIDVDEQRIAEQAQTKVEASQRFPISLTGMFLFDGFLTQGTNNSQFLSRYGDYALGEPGGGGTLRQSIIGLDFHGPRIPGDGRMNGFLAMDFYAQAGSDDVFRIRRGVVSFDWKNRSLIFGQDKSIIAPLQPASYAEVAVPPLSGAGNLWLWRPQVTYEERIPLSKGTRATLEGSVFETDESYTAPQLVGSAQPRPSRPAVQGRVQIQHQWSDSQKITFGIAGDGSTSHILGRSIPSRVVSADFLWKPSDWLEISGTILHGKNFANLGGVPNGVTIVNNQLIVPIRGTAGWAQAAFPLTKRLTFDFYAGRQVNKASDLSAFEVMRTETFAGNVLYRFAPNVVLGFEGARSRVEYLNALNFWTTRYDGTIAYLF